MPICALGFFFTHDIKLGELNVRDLLTPSAFHLLLSLKSSVIVYSSREVKDCYRDKEQVYRQAKVQGLIMECRKIFPDQENNRGVNSTCNFRMLIIAISHSLTRQVG